MRTAAVLTKLRVGFGVLLAISVLLPIYNLSTSFSGGKEAVYAWDLARDDFGSGALLAAAFLGPVIVVGLHASPIRGKWSFLILAAEPAVLAVSAAILLGVAGSAFTFVPILRPWLFVPASGSVGAGTWLALAAVGALQLIWFVSVGERLRLGSRRSGDVAGAPA